MTMAPRHMRTRPVVEDVPSQVVPSPAGQEMGEFAASREVQAIPATRQRRAAVPAVAEQTVVAAAVDDHAVLRRRATPSRPYDDAAYARDRRPLRSRAGLMPALAAALRSVAVVVRVAAAALCVLVLANALARGFMWASVVSATAYVTRAIPAAVAGRFVAPTILGGTFRADIAVLAVILFIVDWACMRLAYGLGGR